MNLVKAPPSSSCLRLNPVLSSGWAFKVLTEQQAERWLSHAPQQGPEVSSSWGGAWHKLPCRHRPAQTRCLDR